MFVFATAVRIGAVGCSSTHSVAMLRAGRSLQQQLSSARIAYNPRGSTLFDPSVRRIHNSTLRRSGAPSGGAGRRGNDDEGDDNAFVRPGPPPLPAAEQREFERLVREKQNEAQFKPALRLNEDDAMHPQYRGKPKPEFEGDTNPETGEVGGPKNNPLRWEGEWTYGGRSTE